MMDITRNQYFFAGVLLVLLGIQFRITDSVVLNGRFTKFLMDRTDNNMSGIGAVSQNITQSDKPLVKKTVIPPDWIGWMLLSIGSVLVLHSWAMKKPGS